MKRGWMGKEVRPEPEEEVPEKMVEGLQPGTIEVGRC